MVNNGARSLNIAIDDVAYFKVIERATFLVTQQGQQYLYEGSLEQLMKDVDAQTFFQLNRQVVACRKSLKSYSATETRKLEVTLQPAATEVVYVSKTRASVFLQWLKQQ